MIKQKIILVFTFTIILTSLHAQNEVNTYDENGKRHGIWQKTYPGSDQLRYKGRFNHGKEIDTFKYYKLKRKKSVLSAIKVFDSNSHKAEVTFMASNGKVVSKGAMDGKKFIGKWLYYHKNSDTIMIEEIYDVDGQLTGQRKVYFGNGNIAETSNYKQGKLDGISKNYDEASKLLQESMYENGKLNGQTSYYDTKGSIKAKGSFKDNTKVGVWEYYSKGILSKKVDHDIDKIIYQKE